MTRTLFQEASILSNPSSKAVGEKEIAFKQGQQIIQSYRHKEPQI